MFDDQQDTIQKFPDVGPALQAMLKHSSITQSALARHIGVDVKVINRLCRGHTHLTMDLATRLGRAFGVHPGVFLFLQYKMDARRASSLHSDIQPISTRCAELGGVS